MVKPELDRRLTSLQPESEKKVPHPFSLTIKSGLRPDKMPGMLSGMPMVGWME